jgi:hypothetical protein
MPSLAAQNRKIGRGQERDRDVQSWPATIIPTKSIEILAFLLDGWVSSGNTVLKSTETVKTGTEISPRKGETPTAGPCTMGCER